MACSANVFNAGRPKLTVRVAAEVTRRKYATAARSAPTDVGGHATLSHPTRRADAPSQREGEGQGEGRSGPTEVGGHAIAGQSARPPQQLPPKTYLADSWRCRPLRRAEPGA